MAVVLAALLEALAGTEGAVATVGLAATVLVSLVWCYKQIRKAV